jgi:hypothetical protein
LVKAGEHCSLENLNLALVRDVLMGAYHRAGPGRPPFNPLGLFRFKLLMALKGYGPQRVSERDIRVTHMDIWIRKQGSDDGPCGWKFRNLRPIAIGNFEQTS